MTALSPARYTALLVAQTSLILASAIGPGVEQTHLAACTAPESRNARTAPVIQSGRASPYSVLM